MTATFQKQLRLTVCRTFLVLEGLFGFLLLSAMIEGGMSLVSGLLYGAVSLCVVDWLCRVLLPAPAHTAATASSVQVEHAQPSSASVDSAVSAAGSAVPSIVAAKPVPFRVVRGGRAA